MKLRVLLLTLLFLEKSFSTTLQVLPFQGLVEKSHLIIRGTVISSTGSMKDSHIWTRYRIRVKETVKGPHQEEVEFLQPGGKMGKYQTFVSGAAEFSTGEEFCFFLWQSKNGNYQILGLEQGHFDLIPFGNQTLVPLTQKQRARVSSGIRKSVQSVTKEKGFLQEPTWKRFKKLIRFYDQ